MAGSFFQKQRNGLQIDEASFQRLYQSYWKKLYHIAYKYLGDVYRSEGMVQEVFTSLWQRRKELVLEEATVENYLVRAIRFRIARNYSDEMRKTKKIQELFKNEVQAEHSTEQQVLYRFLKEEIDHMVQLLPQRCKLVYELSRNEGMNNKEIASSLLITEKTVENQLTKALKFIRKGLRANGID